MESDLQFPSPIYGVSFKLLNGLLSMIRRLSSFRPLYTGLVSNEIKMEFEGSIKELCGFPSPIYGVSFKQINRGYEHNPMRSCFRPLYTGLVSNCLILILLNL